VRRAAALLAAGLLCALAGPVRAQDNSGLTALVATGLRHYQRLEYDSAVISLRRALTRTPGDSLTDSAQARALTYLGASELFRGRRDSALAVFRRLVVLNPRARPDPLVFPPEVQTIYDFARDVTKVVAVQAPRDTSIRLGADRFLARLYASSFHQIIVTLEREDGFTVRTLYAGPISDTLQVYWTGEDTVFLANDSGRLVFTVTSLSSAGRQARVLRLPLDLVMGPQDTLPTPPPLPDSLFLPEHEAAKVGMRALGRGAGIGIAVALLPGLVAGGDAPSGSRFAVAGGLTVAGLVGFFKHRPGRPLPDNISANQSLRDGWQAQIQMTAQENAIRVLQKRLDIHVGRPEILGGTR
jgi:tetratricopeptide (TPR) repeat protein